MRKKTREHLLSLVSRHPEACSVLSMARREGLSGKKAIRFMKKTRRQLARLTLTDSRLALLVLDVQEGTEELASKMGLSLLDGKLIYYTYLEEEVDVSAEIARRTEIDPG